MKTIKKILKQVFQWDILVRLIGIIFLTGLVYLYNYYPEYISTVVFFCIVFVIWSVVSLTLYLMYERKRINRFLMYEFKTLNSMVTDSIKRDIIFEKAHVDSTVNRVELTKKYNNLKKEYYELLVSHTVFMQLQQQVNDMVLNKFKGYEIDPKDIN